MANSLVCPLCGSRTYIVSGRLHPHRDDEPGRVALTDCKASGQLYSDARAMRDGLDAGRPTTET